VRFTDTPNFPIKRKKPDGSIQVEPPVWKMNPPQMAPMKNLPDQNVIVVENTTVTFPQQSAEDRAKEALRELYKDGAYKPGVPYKPT
jgi:hypothetical protein